MFNRKNVRHTLPKRERLVSRKLTETLFGVTKDSYKVTAFPLRAVYKLVPADSPNTTEPVAAQILISVPKKHFHHAVDRNRVKRQVREAYRQQKHHLWQAIPAGSTLVVAFIWMHGQHATTANVEQCMAAVIRKIKRSWSHE